MTSSKAPTTFTVHVPLRFTIRGGRKTIIGQLPQLPTPTRFDDSLAKALARAHRWQAKIEAGACASVAELAQAEKINESYMCRLLRLTLLAPQIVEALLNRRGGNLTVETLVKRFPVNWDEQSAFLGLERKRRADGP
jgi:hypothetical protein